MFRTITTLTALLVASVIWCTTADADVTTYVLENKQLDAQVVVVEDYNRETPACKGETNSNLNSGTVGGMYYVNSKGQPIIVQCFRDDSIIVHELTHAVQDLMDGQSDGQLETITPNIQERWDNNEHPKLINFIKSSYDSSSWLVEYEAYLNQLGLL